MTTRKTKLMRDAEEYLGQPLEDYLPEAVTELGQVAVAEHLGVSKATLGYWLLKLGIRVERVALGPGDSLEVKRAKRPARRTE